MWLCWCNKIGVEIHATNSSVPTRFRYSIPKKKKKRMWTLINYLCGHEREPRADSINWTNWHNTAQNRIRIVYNFSDQVIVGNDLKILFLVFWNRYSSNSKWTDHILQLWPEYVLRLQVFLVNAFRMWMWMMIRQVSMNRRLQMSNQWCCLW